MEPVAELDIDEELVRTLLREQHADLAGLTLRPLASGWDNVMYRLGPDLTVRLPRRAVAAELIRHEQRWLPELAPRLPLPVPVPVRVGQPGSRFAWPWSITTWLPGDPAWTHPPTDPVLAATTLGTFLAALHHPAPAEAPVNPYRGVPLPQRSTRLHDALADLDRDEPGWDVEMGLDRDRLVGEFEGAAAGPGWAHEPVWVHGDLHPLNLLVDGGAMAAVVDFGDLTAGDPATDLAVAWFLLPDHALDAFRQAAGTRRAVDDPTWDRARAWALALSVAYLSGEGHVRDIGRRALIRLAGRPRSGPPT